MQAQERRKSHQAWAGMMPILLTILAAGGALWLVIIYRGRTVLILAERGVLDGAGLPCCRRSTSPSPIASLSLPGIGNRAQPTQTRCWQPTQTVATSTFTSRTASISWSTSRATRSFGDWRQRQ